MIKFNPENKDTLSFIEIIDLATNITDKEEAKQYFNDYVAYISKKYKTDIESATQVVKFDLSYYSDYYSDDVSSRIIELFEVENPHDWTLEQYVDKVINISKIIYQ
jgi:hypothetical protein